MAEDPRRDRPFVVEARPARPPGRSRLPLAALAVAVVAVIGLSAWGLLVAPGPPPTPVPPMPGASAASPVSPDPSSLVLRTFPPATDDGSGILQLSLPTARDALAALATTSGWDQCPMWRALPEGGVVSQAALQGALHGTNAAAGGAMHRVADTLGKARRVWIGGTPDDAVRGFGGTVAVRVDDDPDGVWTGIPEGAGWAAIRLAPQPVRGATAWQVSVRAVPAPYCGIGTGGPPAEVVDVFNGQDALAALFAKAGWNVCRTWQRSELTVTPDPEAIDAAAVGAGLTPADEAWVTVPLPGAYPVTEQVWLGADAATAGTRHGTRLVVVSDEGGGRRAWIASSLDGRPYAAAFSVIETPLGWTAWVPLENAAGVTGDCSIEEGSTDSGIIQIPGDAVPVELARGVEPADAIAERYDWRGCRMTIMESYPLAVDGAVIDEAAVAAYGSGASPPGWLEVPVSVGRVWLGEDVVALAQAADAPFVAWRGDTPFAWLADDTRADEWTVLVTPAGRTAWYPTGGARWPDACPARPSTAPPAVPEGIRSFTCAVDRPRCIEAIEAARGIQPAAFDASTDVGVGAAEGCRPYERCRATPPTEPVIVTARPAGFAGLEDVRAFTVGARQLSGVNRELSRDEWGDAVLAVASRPSLQLPVGPATSSPPCPASGHRGRARRLPVGPARRLGRAQHRPLAGRRVGVLPAVARPRRRVRHPVRRRRHGPGRGDRHGRGGLHRVRGDARRPHGPATLRSVSQARIDRLEPDVRSASPGVHHLMHLDRPGTVEARLR